MATARWVVKTEKIITFTEACDPLVNFADHDKGPTLDNVVLHIRIVPLIDVRFLIMELVCRFLPRDY